MLWLACASMCIFVFICVIFHFLQLPLCQPGTDLFVKSVSLVLSVWRVFVFGVCPQDEGWFAPRVFDLVPSSLSLTFPPCPP